MEGWQVKPLGDVCEFQRGLTYGKSDEVDVSRNVVLRANNVDLATHALDLSELRYISDSIPVPAGKKLRKGSLLICTASGSKSHLGKVAYVDHDYGYAFGGFMGQITPVSGLDGRYLFHALTSPAYKDFIETLSDGVNINNLKFDHLRQFPVPVPPLPEQRRIVAILDEAFEAIATAKANTEKNLQNAREVFDSRLEAIFNTAESGWIQKRLQDVCAKITDGTHQTPKYFDQGVVFLSSRNVTSGKIDWENIKYIDMKQHAEMHKRVAPRINDILLAKNGTTGVAAIVDRDVTFDIYVSLALIRSLGAVLPRFLLHFINSPLAKRQFNKRLKGVGVPNLHLEEIREVLINFPVSLEKQARVLAHLDELRDQVEGLRDINARKLTALEELKKSLLYQAFSGAMTAKTTDKQLAEVA